jgi:hypothetical protein
MRNKMILLLSSLIFVIMVITPVFAKTKTEIKVTQMGGINVPGAEKALHTPNGKIDHFWGVDGTGTVTLYQSDGETVIDTFVSTSVIQLKTTDSAVKLILSMLWESDTVDGGFKGNIRFMGARGNPLELKALYQGYGAYDGQTLMLRGTSFAGVQTYTGTLIA